jgi:hypothetical protein
VTLLTSKAISILGKSGWYGLDRNIEQDLSDLQYRRFEPLSNSIVSILKHYSGLKFQGASEYQGCRLSGFLTSLLENRLAAFVSLPQKSGQSQLWREAVREMLESN